VRYTFTGTHRGPLADIPATGRQVSVANGIGFYRLAAGKVTQVDFAWDKFGLLQQLGVLAVGNPAST
jgi:predicted ester cyclase